MEASAAKAIFQAIAEANRHPDPVEYAERAMEHWKNPAEAPKPKAEKPKKGD